MKMNYYNYYAGIGSRNTPKHICDQMTAYASALENRGLVLRSGGADGADMAFERGVELSDNKEIYLPYRQFNGNPSNLYPETDCVYFHSHKAIIIAKKYHPNFERLNHAGKAFMIRNSYQVLGNDLETPSKFILCWTPNGSGTGGTGQAIRIANDYGIPVYDLGCGALVESMVEDLINEI